MTGKTPTAEELEQRLLDEQCAHTLGYQTIWGESVFGLSLYLWDEGAIRTEIGATNCTVLGARWERLRIGGEVRELMVRLCPAFSGRLEDAKILEDEVERRKLIGAYVATLVSLLDTQIVSDNQTVRYLAYMSDFWALIRATPEQRARAFVQILGI